MWWLLRNYIECCENWSMIENEIIYGRKKNFYLCIVRKSMDFMDCYGNVIMIWDYVWDIGGCYMVY